MPILYPQGSNESLPSCIDESKLNETQKEVAEIRSSGNISKSVYTSYLSAVGSNCNVFLFFFMFTLTQLLTSGEDYWISFWYYLHIIYSTRDILNYLNIEYVLDIIIQSKSSHS